MSLKAGTRVRLSAAGYAALLAGHKQNAHIDRAIRAAGGDPGRWPTAEFKNCIGVVLGPVMPGWEEVDVRWEPSGLKYGYHPDHLEIVDEQRKEPRG